EKLSAEEALALIPIAGHLEMHDEIVRLVKIALDAEIKPEKHLLYLLSQALYNIGERDEARRIMADIRDYFGEFSNAEYVLRAYAKQPDSVKYGEDIPESEREEINSRVNSLMLMSEEELREFDRTHTAEFDNLDYYFQYAMHSGNYDLMSDFIAKGVSLGGELFRTYLSSDSVSYKGLSILFLALLEANSDAGKESLEFDVVARHRFRHIEIEVPAIYRILPKTMLLGLQIAVADVIFLDDNAQDTLQEIMSSLYGITLIRDENDEELQKKRKERFRRIRNEKAFAALLLTGVYYGFDQVERRADILERYGVSERLVAKYRKILFEELNEIVFGNLNEEDDEDE
ncbi:MAG: hypothetical protein K2G31_03865, partial [Clostridia bacterium]|nr:hypothetical protein [Clostridia bacterium]